MLAYSTDPRESYPGSSLPDIPSFSGNYLRNNHMLWPPVVHLHLRQIVRVPHRRVLDVSGPGHWVLHLFIRRRPVTGDPIYDVSE